MILNPKTGRLLSRTSKAYRSYLNQGYRNIGNRLLPKAVADVEQQAYDVLGSYFDLKWDTPKEVLKVYKRSLAQIALDRQAAARAPLSDAELEEVLEGKRTLTDEELGRLLIQSNWAEDLQAIPPYKEPDGGVFWRTVEEPDWTESEAQDVIDMLETDTKYVLWYECTDEDGRVVKDFNPVRFKELNHRIFHRGDQLTAGNLIWVNERLYERYGVQYIDYALLPVPTWPTDHAGNPKYKIRIRAGTRNCMIRALRYQIRFGGTEGAAPLTPEQDAKLKALDAKYFQNGCTLNDLEHIQSTLKMRVHVYNTLGQIMWKSKKNTYKNRRILNVWVLDDHAEPYNPKDPPKRPRATSVRDFDDATNRKLEALEKERQERIEKKLPRKGLWSQVVLTLIDFAVANGLQTSRIWVIGETLITHTGVMYRSASHRSKMLQAFTDEYSLDAEEFDNMAGSNVDDLNEKELAHLVMWRKAELTIGGALTYRHRRWLEREKINKTPKEFVNPWKGSTVESRPWNSAVKEVAEMIDMHAAYLNSVTDWRGKGESQPWVKRYGFPSSNQRCSKLTDLKKAEGLTGIVRLTSWAFAKNLHPYITQLLGMHLAEKRGEKNGWIPTPLLFYCLEKGILTNVKTVEIIWCLNKKKTFNVPCTIKDPEKYIEKLDTVRDVDECRMSAAEMLKPRPAQAQATKPKPKKEKPQPSLETRLEQLQAKLVKPKETPKMTSEDQAAQRNDRTLGVHFIGSCAKKARTSSMLVFNKDYADYIVSELAEQNKLGESVVTDRGALITYETDEERSQYLHIRSFVLAYMHICMFEMLMRFDPKTVVHIATDAIAATSIPDEVRQSLKPKGQAKFGEWVLKPEDYHFHPKRHWQDEPIDDLDLPDSEKPELPFAQALLDAQEVQVRGESPTTSTRMLFTGPGGTGKSHLAVLATKGMSVAMLCQSNRHARRAREKYGIPAFTFQSYFSYNYTKSGLEQWDEKALHKDKCHDVVIWDEVFMTATGYFRKFLPILERRGCQVIMTGDYGQLTPFDDKKGPKEFLEEWATTFIDFTVDRRSQCEKLKALKKKMYLQPNDAQLQIFREDLFNADWEEALAMWTPNDVWLCSTNAMGDRVSEALLYEHERRFPNELCPVRWLGSEHYGQVRKITIPGTIERVDAFTGQEAKVPLDVVKNGLSHGWAYAGWSSIHKYQSETFDQGKLFVVDDSLEGWIDNAVYTACSRPVRMDQLVRVLPQFDLNKVAIPTDEQKEIDLDHIKRALARHVNFDKRKKKPVTERLETKHVEQMKQDQNGKCATCSVEMFFSKFEPGHWQMYSIDRIDDSLGHEPKNVRLTCLRCQKNHRR